MLTFESVIGDMHQTDKTTRCCIHDDGLSNGTKNNRAVLELFIRQLLTNTQSIANPGCLLFVLGRPMVSISSSSASVSHYIITPMEAMSYDEDDGASGDETTTNIPMGMQVLNTLRLGLAPGQTGIDIRDKVKKKTLVPLPNGLLLNKRTGKIVGRYPFSNDMIDRFFSFQDMLRQNPDFIYVEALAGKLGRDPFSLIQDLTKNHLVRIDEQVKQVLKQHAMNRNLTIDQRSKHVHKLQEQIDDLRDLLDRFDKLEKAFQPTVDRWYWLATVTGTGFTGKAVPYWLLTEYVYPQYTLQLPMDLSKENIYWTHTNSGVAKLFDGIHEMMRFIKFDPDTKKEIGTMYLMLRDFVFSSLLVLQPVEKNSKKTDVYNGIVESCAVVMTTLNKQCNVTSLAKSSLRGETITALVGDNVPLLPGVGVDLVTYIGDRENLSGNAGYLSFVMAFDTFSKKRNGLSFTETWVLIEIFSTLDTIKPMDVSASPGTPISDWIRSSASDTWGNQITNVNLITNDGLSFGLNDSKLTQMLHFCYTGMDSMTIQWANDVVQYLGSFFSDKDNRADFGTRTNDLWNSNGPKIREFLRNVRTHAITPLLFTTELIRSTMVGSYIWKPLAKYKTTGNGEGGIKVDDDSTVDPVPGVLSLNDDAFSGVSWEFLFRNHLRGRQIDLATDTGTLRSINGWLGDVKTSTKHSMRFLWQHLVTRNSGNITAIDPTGVPSTGHLVPYFGSRRVTGDKMIVSFNAPARKETAAYADAVESALTDLNYDNRFQSLENEIDAFPPQSILLQMILLVHSLGKQQKDAIAKKLTTLETEMNDVTAIIKSAMTGDTSGAYTEIGEVLKNLHIPEFAWFMSPIFTGRIIFEPDVRTATDSAYTYLQGLALIPPASQQYNGATPYKRRRIETYNGQEISFAHFKGVPLDILTGYCDVTNSGKPDILDKNRPRIDLTKTPGGLDTVIQLRDAMTTLAAACYAGVRQTVPEQYKTVKQYEHQPVALQAAADTMRSFRFALVDPLTKAWSVHRV